MCSWYASPWSARPPLRTSELRSVSWLNNPTPPSQTTPPPDPPSPSMPSLTTRRHIYGSAWLLSDLLIRSRASNSLGFGISLHDLLWGEVWTGLNILQRGAQRLMVVWYSEHHQGLADQITNFSRRSGLLLQSLNAFVCFAIERLCFVYRVLVSKGGQHSVSVSH